MPTNEQLAAVVIVALVITAVVVGAIVYYSLTLSGSGTVLAIGLEAYTDAGLTERASSINWGTIPPGGYSQVTLYLHSNSTGPSTWTLSTQNWQPANAQNYMILTWSYDNAEVQPGETEAVTFTLAVNQSISGITNFSFDTVITAQG